MELSLSARAVLNTPSQPFRSSSDADGHAASTDAASAAAAAAAAAALWETDGHEVDLQRVPARQTSSQLGMKSRARFGVHAN